MSLFRIFLSKDFLSIRLLEIDMKYSKDSTSGIRSGNMT